MQGGGGDVSPSWTNQKNPSDVYRVAARGEKSHSHGQRHSKHAARTEEESTVTRCNRKGRRENDPFYRVRLSPTAYAYRVRLSPTAYA